MSIKSVVNFLKENPVQYLATTGLDGKPKCRPFMFSMEHDNKLWFCTNNLKEVYKEIQSNPNIELSASSNNSSWIRIDGLATFENNLLVKEECLKVPLIKLIYETPDNPIFETFYIDNATATISDFSGNPPKKFKL